MRTLVLSSLLLCSLVILGCGGSISINGGDDETVFDPTAYAGTWTGQWINVALGRQGPATLVVAMNVGTQTFTIDFDMDGDVLPGVDPPALNAEGDYTATGGTADVAGTALGDLELTFDDTGAINGTLRNVPHPDVTRIDFTGAGTPTRITINWQAQLATGGTVAGTLVLNKQ